MMSAALPGQAQNCVLLCVPLFTVPPVDPTGLFAGRQELLACRQMVIDLSRFAQARRI